MLQWAQGAEEGPGFGLFRVNASHIPVEMYKRLIAEREARFRVLDRIRGRLPEVPPEEVERDVAEAVAAVRAGDAENRA